MSAADKYFKAEIERFKKEGFYDKDFNVRPRWEDGTPAHTYKIFGAITEYDLEKEFPILTLKRQFFKNAVKEVLWIFQKKSTNIHDLGLHIWDAWADKDGDIGRTYAYALREKIKYPEGTFDQVDYLLYKLKNNPMDRRMMLQLFDPHNTLFTTLPPCVMTYLFDVSNGRLNMLVLQRSGDTCVASGAGMWNEVSASILLSMFAQVSGLKAGKLLHIVNNAHIYDRHLELADKLIKNEEFEAPKLWVNPEVKDFYRFTPDDFKLINYKYSEFKDKFPVAI